MYVFLTNSSYIAPVRVSSKERRSSYVFSGKNDLHLNTGIVFGATVLLTPHAHLVLRTAILIFFSSSTDELA